MPKSLTVWITTNCGKVFMRWEYQTILPASWGACFQVKNQQLKLDMGKQVGSKLGKEFVKAVYCHPAYLTYMQSTSAKCQAGWIITWNQDCWEKYQQPQICRWYDSNGRKQRGTKEPLNEKSEKAGLKLNNGHRTRKLSFHSNPKERQCKRMFKLLHNCTHLTR